MANLSGFDANAIPPNEGFDVLPAGEYDVCIIDSEMKPTKKGDGQMLRLELQVLSGPYQNRRLWDNLNLVNPNTQAVQIAQGTLSSICRAVGVMTPNDSSELHNKPMRIKVKVRKSDEYGDQNQIVSYKPRQSGPVTQPAPVGQAAATGAKPW